MSLAQLILGIPPLPVVTPKVTLGTSSDSFTSYNGVQSVQMVEPRRETNNFDTQIAFDPNADVLWPGSIVQGRTLATGILAPIALRRRPGTITITNLTVLPGGNTNGPQYSRVLEDPRLDTAQEAIQQLVTQNIAPNTPAKIFYSAQQFFSLDHALFKIGLSAQWLSGSARAQLESDSSVEKTSFIVKFVQSYYSVSFNPPSAPDSFFADDVTEAQAANYMGPGNPPAYISTVSYGRTLFFLVTSSRSALELRAALDAAFHAGFASGSAHLSTSQSQIIQESEIKVFVLGGPSDSAVDLITGDKVASLKQYLSQGANFTIGSPGVPISYQARYLRDNDVARLSLTTDYNVTSYRAQNVKSVTVTFHLSSDDKDKEEEIQLTVRKGDLQVGYGGFGRNVCWGDPGSYSCTVTLSVPVSVVDVPGLKVRMFKTPHGSATGCGMQGSIDADCTLEGGSTVHMFSVADRRYGDNNDYDVMLPS